MIRRYYYNNIKFSFCSCVLYNGRSNSDSNSFNLLSDEFGSKLEHWCLPWRPTTLLQLSLPLTGGLVSLHPISLTWLRSRDQVKFKYSYLFSPSEAPFKNKTMTDFKCSKINNTLET